MQADRVRPVGGARREHPGRGARHVAAWVDGERRPVGEVEPGQQEQLVARMQVGRCSGDLGDQVDHDLGRALVALPGCVRAVDDRAAHPADGVEVGTVHPTRLVRRPAPGRRRRREVGAGFGTCAPLGYSLARPLVRRHLAELPQGRKAARAGELWRVCGGSFLCPQRACAQREPRRGRAAALAGVASVEGLTVSVPPRVHDGWPDRTRRRSDVGSARCRRQRWTHDPCHPSPVRPRPRPSASGRRPRSRASTSTSRTGSRSPSWARRAPASRRSCTASPGILRPTTGRVALDGQRGRPPVATASARCCAAATTASSSSSGQLLPELPAIENVALPLMLGGGPAREAPRRRGRAGSAALGLGRAWRAAGPASCRAARRSASRSRGRSSPAPAVVFADEPTGALDQATGHDVMRILTGRPRRPGRRSSSSRTTPRSPTGATAASRCATVSSRSAQATR